jgi:hypothetical protein
VEAPVGAARIPYANERPGLVSRERPPALSPATATQLPQVLT